MAALLVVSVSILIAACGSGSGAAMKRIEKSGRLVVGTSAGYAPFEYHTMAEGKDTIAGIDISIAEEISKDLRAQIEISDMEFNGLLEALNDDKVDIVISSMNPDEERKKTVDFSKIYYESKQGVLVRAENKDKIKTVGDLKGKKAGAQLATVQEKIVKEQIADADIITLGKIPDLITELKNKKIDALVLELPVANGYVKNNNDLILTDIKVKNDIGGLAIAVKKNNSDLVEQIDKTIDRLIKEGLIEKFVQEEYEKNVTKSVTK